MRYVALLALFAVGCGPENELRPNERPDEPAPTDPTFPEPIDLPALVLNEVVADNESVVNGPDGYSLPDYVEIVNAGEVDVDLSRVEIASADGRWTGPEGLMLAPGERTVVWFGVDSGVDVDMYSGVGIDKENDEIALLYDGYVVDQVDVDDLLDDISLARIPDVTGDFVMTVDATPNAENPAEPSATLDVPNELMFVTDYVHQIRFTMTPDAYNKINQSDRPVVHVEVQMDGVNYQDVGLKLKGSASYQTMDGKPGFVLDMNAWVLGTRFRGQRALGLHTGNVLDPTRVRDFLTYQLAREAGLIAPRVGWAEVYVNDTYYGIYIMLERYEEELIEDRRPGDGELGMIFEGNESQNGGWASDFGDGTPNFDYEEGPLPAPPDAITSINQVDLIVSGQATDDRVAELWNYLNKEQFLTYMAWEAVVNHTDGYKAPNNWRFYVDPHTYKLEWLPSGAEWTWDFDSNVYSSGGNVADFCLKNTLCKYDFSVKAIEVADLADALDLLGQFDTLSAWLDPLIKADPRYEAMWGNTIPGARASTAEHLVSNPQTVRQQVYQTFPDLKP